MANTDLPIWAWFLIGVGVLLIALGFVFWLWMIRQKMSVAEATAELHALGVELAQLPGRLRRLARDPRLPRSVRWMIIGLAIYIASPIDPIPDFLPGIGHLDEIILVPILLRKIRRRIPDDVWLTHFPPRPTRSDRTPAP